MENREFALEALAYEDDSGDVDILGETAYYICLPKEDRGKAWAFAKGESG